MGFCLHVVDEGFISEFAFYYPDLPAGMPVIHSAVLLYIRNRNFARDWKIIPKL